MTSTDGSLDGSLDGSTGASPARPTGGAHPTIAPNCAAVLERLYEFLDDEMAVTDVEVVRRHLAECAPCVNEYDLERAMKALVRRCCAEQAPATLRVRVMTTITQVRVIDS